LLPNSKPKENSELAPRIAMVAGEASGDLLASLLIKGILARWPQAHIYGIGGESMCALGFKALWPAHKLSVRGYFEVLLHLKEILGIRNALRKELLANPPDLFIGVDAPDFNLNLEQSLKAEGVPCLHFVCPSIWAWRANRALKLAKSVDHVLCIFPFEPAILAQYEIGATYVGHPLAQVVPFVPDRLTARSLLRLDPCAKVVVLMPGSRASEVEQMTERFLRAALIMQKSLPNLCFLLPVVPHLEQYVDRLCERIPVANLKVLKGMSHEALTACDAVLVASGTATLEAALFKRPMVIGYHVNWLSYLLIWPQRILPWIGLPNILAGKEIVPELLQAQATPIALAAEVLKLLGDQVALDALMQTFNEQLNRDTPAIATKVIEDLMGQAKGE
jgi:lipid-A-disaccharide synthase